MPFGSVARYFELGKNEGGRLGEAAAPGPPTFIPDPPARPAATRNFKDRVRASAGPVSRMDGGHVKAEGRKGLELGGPSLRIRARPSGASAGSWAPLDQGDSRPMLKHRDEPDSRTRPARDGRLRRRAATETRRATFEPAKRRESVPSDAVAGGLCRL